jgi:hypothetical protein
VTLRASHRAFTGKKFFASFFQERRFFFSEEKKQNILVFWAGSATILAML